MQWSIFHFSLWHFNDIKVEMHTTRTKRREEMHHKECTSVVKITDADLKIDKFYFFSLWFSFHKWIKWLNWFNANFVHSNISPLSNTVLYIGIFHILHTITTEQIYTNALLGPSIKVLLSKFLWGLRQIVAFDIRYVFDFRIKQFFSAESF